MIPLRDAFRENLRRIEVACQKGLCERFDASIGAATVNMPFAGRYQMTPEEGMVAKLPVFEGETDDATAMAYGFIPGISKWSPFHGAAYAVMVSLAKLAAMGAAPLDARLTFQEYFERLREDPRRWGKPAAALLGAFLAQKEMGSPPSAGRIRCRAALMIWMCPHAGQLCAFHDQSVPNRFRRLPEGRLARGVSAPAGG